MLIRLLINFGLIFQFSLCFSQGGIDHIKNQPYMKDSRNVHCENPLGDLMTDRICANLAFQKADSLLSVVYDSLLLEANSHFIDSLQQKIIHMQESWRSMRNQHCGLIHDKYQGAASGNLVAIDYLHCLTTLTENRTRELRVLRQQLIEP